MLNEKLMEVLNSIQSSLCLETEKKLAYVPIGNFAASGCMDCDGRCEGGCASFWTPQCSACMGGCAGGCAGIAQP